MRCALIVAMTQKGVIGHQQKLPWHLSEDLQHFKKTTLGFPIVMGRKTFESIGKALPGRRNLVLSTNPNFYSKSVEVFKNLDEVLAQTKNEKQVFFIGGQLLYEKAIDFVDEVYVTWILKDFTGDTFFPLQKLKQNFKLIEKSALMKAKANGLEYQFCRYEKNEAIYR